MGNRIAAILFGIAIIFPLVRWWSAPWYVYMPLGVLGYGCVRYIGYFVRERRYIKNTMDEAVRSAKGRNG
jgi:hypothetical protein